MDERELQRLLRGAVDEPPEPSFTVHDVTAASRRASARRRAAFAGIAGAVVVLAGGGIVIGAVLAGDEDPASTVAARGQQPGTSGQPGDGRERVPNAQDLPKVSPKQGGETAGEDGPRAESASGCDTVDRELATALAGELPVGPRAEPVPSPLCGTGMRAAAFRVDGATVSALLVPRGVVPQFPRQPEGTTFAGHHMPTGATVVVAGTPASDSSVPSPPLPGAGPLPTDRASLQDIAAAVARVVRG